MHKEYADEQKYSINTMIAINDTSSDPLILDCSNSFDN